MENENEKKTLEVFEEPEEPILPEDILDAFAPDMSEFKSVTKAELLNELDNLAERKGKSISFCFYPQLEKDALFVAASLQKGMLVLAVVRAGKYGNIQTYDIPKNVPLGTFIFNKVRANAKKAGLEIQKYTEMAIHIPPEPDKE